jgi:hypothetical protein
VHVRALKVALVSAVLLLGMTVSSVSAEHWASAVAFSGNPSCAGGTKIEPVVSGTYAVDFGGFAGTIELTVTGNTLAFETDSPFHTVTSVIVKGGPGGITYTYALPGVTADSGLTAGINPSNNRPYGLSHVCFFTAKLSG